MSRRQPLRLIALGAVAAGVALPLARRRLGLHPAATAIAAAGAPVGVAVAVPRSRKRDVAVYALQMWAYIVVHELPHDDPERLERRAHIDYPIDFDRLMFGKAPTAELQRVLSRPGHSTVLDHVLVYCHWAWFLQPHVAAGWILWRHPERFPRAATMICAVFDLGLIGYFAVPTAPPWYAAEQGRIPGTRRIMVEVGERVWGRFWPWLYGLLGGNPLAAMPSLHFGTSVMAAHVLGEVGPVPGALGWTYASVLGLALVYLGEHYVIDLVAGLALAESVRLALPART
jgi:membrane-associated phospholipid phosphatase